VEESLYKGRFVEPKSAVPRQTVNLPSILLEALQVQRARQAERKLQVGRAYQDDDLIFCTVLGTPMDRGDVLKRDFWPLLKQTGLQRVRFHDLRHTFATLLIDQGQPPKCNQAQLGDASIQVTMDRYSQLLPDAHQHAANGWKRASLDRPLEDR
jgi:integrase